MDTIDSLPEIYPYRDEGCALSPSCLHCPFPSCLDERPRGRQGWLKERRRQEIARLHARGKSTRDMARIFGISQRSIQRALAAGNRTKSGAVSICQSEVIPIHREAEAISPHHGSAANAL